MWTKYVYSFWYSWQQSEQCHLPYVPTLTGRVVFEIGSQGTSGSFFCKPGVERTFKQRCRALPLIDAGVIFNSPCNCCGCPARTLLGVWCRKAVHRKLFAEQHKQLCWTYNVQKQSCICFATFHQLLFTYEMEIKKPTIPITNDLSCSSVNLW